MKELVGVWKITKKYYNKYGSPFNTAEGFATLKSLDDKQTKLVLHDEVMQGKSFGTVGRAYKSYVFKSKDGFVEQYGVNQLSKNVEEYKMYDLHFQVLNGITIASGTYYCSPDSYTGTITIHDNNNFNIKYVVFGPEKDYSVVTEYERDNISMVGKQEDVESTGASAF